MSGQKNLQGTLLYTKFKTPLFHQGFARLKHTAFQYTGFQWGEQATTAENHVLFLN